MPIIYSCQFKFQKALSHTQLTEAFTLIGGAIHVHLGADDCAKGHKHLRQFVVAKFLGEVVNKQIAAFRAYKAKIRSTTLKLTFELKQEQHKPT